VVVAKADEMSRGETFKTEKEFDEMIKYAEDIKNKWSSKKVKEIFSKQVNGKHIMELLNIGPSKKVGKVKKKTIEWIINTGETNQKNIDSYIMEFK
jgi:hypothetical protein